MSEKIKNAFDTLQNEIHADAGYAWSWHCNIAMNIFDELCGKLPLDLNVHRLSNDAAARVIQETFDYDIKQTVYWAGLFNDNHIED